MAIRILEAQFCLEENSPLNISKIQNSKSGQKTTLTLLKAPLYCGTVTYAPKMNNSTARALNHLGTGTSPSLYEAA